MADKGIQLTDAVEAEAGKGGLSRRDVAKLGAWAVPAVMLAASAPAAAASGDFTVGLLRAGTKDAGWTDWQGTATTTAPGMAFSHTGVGGGSETASIVFTTATAGTAPAPTDIFDTPDGLVVNPAAAGSSKTHSYTVPVSLTGTQTKSIVIKKAKAANGSYTVTFGVGSASFAIQNAHNANRQVKNPA